ncbi:MAG: 2'-deoxycytidine 5'-triphosphate deaminase [Balneolales bacterium]|nr:2'-deoxycytidine 5'-triphosphate deaminase [Balneolales bacterium]
MNFKITDKGILPVQHLKLLIDAGLIGSDEANPIQRDQLQPNSLDLRLGKTAYRVRCGFLPEKETVLQKVNRLCQHEFSIQNGGILEPNCTYIIPLLETLRLPESCSGMYRNLNLFGERGSEYITLETTDVFSARTNPKSTTGRLDIFTRVVTDYSRRFEDISPGYSGPLYLEVVPKSFPIRVQTGQRLNQLRIRHGNALLSDDDIRAHHSLEPLLLNNLGDAVLAKELKLDSGLFMSVNLEGRRDEIIGYRARKNRAVIDLSKIAFYNTFEFWEPIYAGREEHLILEPEAFYIFASLERCRIPSSLASEMVPYDTGSGELRTHYAGFFDSGFGFSNEGKGARAVLEVRSHDVPFLVEHGQTFFSMVFEKNTESPEMLYGSSVKSNYQGQSLKLSKHFKEGT